MVVKAEGEHGRRLHIDKDMLHEWREDFARMMREQGIAANATSRVERGQNKGGTKDSMYRAQRRGVSSAAREQAIDVAKELKETGTIRDPARKRLLEIRKAVLTNWMRIAEALDRQNEIALAGDVRYFANHLPRVLTDRERIAVGILNSLNAQRSRPDTRPLEKELVR